MTAECFQQVPRMYSINSPFFYKRLSPFISGIVLGKRTFQKSVLPRLWRHNLPSLYPTRTHLRSKNRTLAQFTSSTCVLVPGVVYILVARCSFMCQAWVFHWQKMTIELKQLSFAVDSSLRAPSHLFSNGTASFRKAHLYFVPKFKRSPERSVKQKKKPGGKIQNGSILVQVGTSDDIRISQPSTKTPSPDLVAKCFNRYLYSHAIFST